MATKKRTPRKRQGEAADDRLAHDGIDSAADASETPTEDDPSTDEIETARSDYQGHLKAVEELAEMTATQEWGRRHAWIQREIKTARAKLETAEKPREVLALQQKIVAYREFLRVLRQPVDDMTNFIREMPLFATGFPKHASWNEALGRAELRDAAPADKKRGIKESTT